MNMGDYYGIDEDYGAPDEETPGGSPIFFSAPRPQRARPEKLEKGTWRTKDKRVLKISEMEDGHLVNALRMLKRDGWIGPRTLHSYLGPGPNGDMAQEMFAEEADMMLTRPVHPAVDELEDELRRRRDSRTGGG